MENVYFKNSSRIKEKPKSEKIWLLNLYAFIFAFLLLMRDWSGMGVNKFTFVAITLVAVASLDIKKTLCLFCFLMPLYVGLPGNYMTFVFLARFLFEWKHFKFTPLLFISTMLACVFMLLQNIVLGATAIAEMATIPGLIIVMFLFSYEGDLDKKNMIIYYAIGVAATGLIMLMAALNDFSFDELLTATNRLGSIENQYSAMTVKLDPNYFGLFTVAAITVGYPLLFGNISKNAKILLLVSLFASLAVALIGLSRAFVLVLLLWFFFIFVTQAKLKNVVVSVFIIAIVFAIVLAAFPDVLDAIMERFAGDDMAGGNGRVSGIISYFDQWIETFSTFVFGIGMYECSVHCMPLQIVFGGGVIYSFIMLLFFFGLLGRVKTMFNRRRLMDYVPMFLTFLMTCTVPIATSLTFMFPFVISIYSLKEDNRVDAN